MLSHDRNGKPIEWSATEQLKRQRKALRDGMLACVLILLAWILLLMLVAPRLNAQEIGLGANMSRLSPKVSLPDMPEPNAAPTLIAKRNPAMSGRFWDRPNRIEAVTMFSLAAADMTQTCRFLARGEHERWLTQSCGANVAITAGFTAAALLGAYALHRSGHHRLERLPMLYMTATSARGIVMSKRWGGW